MESFSYRNGVTFGLDAYLTERQRCSTFDQPHIVGYLAACKDGSSEFFAGALHGLALGADLHAQQQAATLDWRRSSRAAAGRDTRLSLRVVTALLSTEDAATLAAARVILDDLESAAATEAMRVLGSQNAEVNAYDLGRVAEAAGRAKEAVVNLLVVAKVYAESAEAGAVL